MNNIVHKIWTTLYTKYEQDQAGNADSQSDTTPPKEIKENKEIKKDTYIKDDFLKLFRSEKSPIIDIM